ncbi:MAG: hypothetical protein AB2L14_36935 [Candidatus Xenobiia bacterium LiM19]
MKSGMFLFLIAMLTVLAFAAFEATPPGYGSAPIPEEQRMFLKNLGMVLQTWSHYGRTHAQIIRNLGKPQQQKVEKKPPRSKMDRETRYYTLVYSGLKITTCDNGYAEFVRDVTLSDKKYDVAMKLKTGCSKDLVRRVLGPSGSYSYADMGSRKILFSDAAIIFANDLEIKSGRRLYYRSDTSSSEFPMTEVNFNFKNDIVETIVWLASM